MSTRRVRALIVVVIGVVLMAPASPAAAVDKPSTPTNLVVTPRVDSARITWSPTSDTTYYTACLLTSGTATSCYRTAKLTGPGVTFTNLKPTGGRDYFFYVVAHGPGGSSARSEKVEFDLLARSTTPPAVPTDVQVRATTTTVTFSWPAVARATSYYVCLWRDGSTGACHERSESTSSLSVTVTGLPPTSGNDYAYVLRAVNSAGSTDSRRAVLNLPVGNIATFTLGESTTTTIDLTWTAAANAERYRVQIAPVEDLRTNLKTQFTTGTRTTVTGLTPATRYWVRVRGENGTVLGRYTAKQHRVLESDPFDVSVMTYNLCGQDKCRDSSGIQTWSKRKALAGSIVRGSGADIVSTQESGDKDTNFITELPGFKRAAYKSAKSLFYRSSRFTMTRTGSITLDSQRKRYAVWAQLRDRTTLTSYFVVDPHLEPFKGKARDDIRAIQMRVLLKSVDTLNSAHLPVVFAGDFNSNKNNATYSGGYDAVHIAFDKAGIPDSYDIAIAAGRDPKPLAIYSQWNSANQGRVQPPAMNSDHVDHIYLDPRITVREWRTMPRFRRDSDGDLMYRTPFASDHNPVRALLTIPGRVESP